VGVIMREVSVLAAAGAGAGICLSLWGVSAIRALFLTIPRVEQVRLDWRALLFTVGATALATALFGLAPALETLRTELGGRLYQATRTQARGRRRLQQAVVASQFAVTLVLLLGTGLLVRSYSKLNQVQPGFDPSHVITFHVGAEWGENRPAIGRMQHQLLDELAKLPGVEAAGLTNFLPATGATLRFEIFLQGSSGNPDTGKALVGERTLGGNYLQALRMPLLEGEGCGELSTDPKAPITAIVNQSFVRQYGKGAPVVGRHFSFDQQSWLNTSPRIVGVIADAKEDGLGAPGYPYVYTCLPGGSWPDPEYVVRTAGDPRQILSAIRQVVHRVAPSRAVFGVTTVEEVVASSLDTPRLSAQVLALFAATALTLAAVGLYSLVMLAVTAQTKEIGLRVALGADPRRIVAGVILMAARPVLVGLGVGAVLAVLALNTKALQSLLFGIRLTDGVTLISVVSTLAAVAVIAALGPARRAAAIDPIQALREE
jgi:putative ABC transport system permease protein